MNAEQIINQKLNNYPIIKKSIKSVYQHLMYAVSPKIKSEGDIHRLSPDDDYEYFFGYYDKSPWDSTGRYVLCLKVKNAFSDVAPKDSADIVLIDTQNNNEVKKIATTNTWNVQQGCMAQWLGPDFNSKIIYNDFRNGKYCSVITDVFTLESRELEIPVYSVSTDGTFALSLDFSRLHRMRPGYGYSNIKDETENEKVPDCACIYKLDIEKNTVSNVASYRDFYEFETRPEMKNAEHKVNHIMLSPDGKRFMVIHRWFCGQRKYSRLITMNVDGTDVYNLSDDDMVSHCNWKNNEYIIGFENKNGQGAGYYLMKDKSRDFERLWSDISSDGHPSYSPDGKFIVTDTYPNRNRISIIKLLNKNYSFVIAKVFAPFKYDNDVRCDLHPRWSRDGKQICFDSAFEGKRGLYSVSLDGIKTASSENVGKYIPEVKHNNRKKIVFLNTSCRKSGPMKVVLNIIKNLDFNVFDPILITIYDEEKDSMLNDILPYVTKHYLVKTGKKAILLNQTKNLEKLLDEIKPDIIHSTGVFPCYAASNIGKYNNVITLHSYIFEDYIKKYGNIKGEILVKLHLSAVRKTKYVLACSESLSRIYAYNKKLKFDYIRNGIDIKDFVCVSKSEKNEIRKKLGIPEDSVVFIYTGQFIKIKNVPLLLEGFNSFSENKNVYLYLLGDGEFLEELKNKYSHNKKIVFTGNVDNVGYYLNVADVYLSASTSEGMPNGVMEALSVGVPVLLSDIPQHLEILNTSENFGCSFTNNNLTDFIKKLNYMYEKFDLFDSNEIFNIFSKNFSSVKMSEEYQEYYNNILG